MKVNYINIILPMIFIQMDAINIKVNMVQMLHYMTEKMNLIKIIYLYVKLIVNLKA